MMVEIASAPRHRIRELLDIPHIQSLADANFLASGLPMTMTDAVDGTMLVKAGWPGMCQGFHRTNPVSARRCLDSEVQVSNNIGDCEARRYKCKNGLWHIGIPIMVAGAHLATLYITQFFLEGEIVDREFFVQQGQELGFDIDAYLAALGRLPVFSEQKVDYGLAFYKVMARFIAEIAEKALTVIRATDLLREQEDFQSLLHNVNIGVYRVAMPGRRLLQVNGAMAKIFGYETVNELLDHTINDLSCDAEERAAIFERLVAKGAIHDRFLRAKKKDGTIIWASITAKAQFGVDGSIQWVDGVVEDVTQRKMATDELRNLSEVDALTNIFNRRKLSELLSLEAQRARHDGRPLSIIFFDIDNFKLTNDRFGHEAGDRVLKVTAEIVSAQLRRSNVFARYGGDEFVILCPDTDLAGARCLTEKIRSMIELHDYPMAERISISAGVTLFSPDDLTEMTALVRADEALYLAKSAGRNMVRTKPE